MLPVLLMEPSSAGKRRHYSQVVTGPKAGPQPSLEDVKMRLRELREYSLAHLGTSADGLTARLAAYPGVKVTFAADVTEAVARIAEISNGSRIAINKSAVVGKELMPALVSAGFRVIESYFAELKPFEKRFSEYWQLPALPFETRLGSFATPLDLAEHRQSALKRNGAKDIVGLLGVNAVSASDGSVVLFQHMRNIGKVFEQAREVVLVVGLDKIVRNTDDAIFQTKCMAVFGCEALPLGMDAKTGSEASIDSQPFEIPPEETTGKIHVILFDNGRSRVLRSGDKDLLACIGCRACTKGCPTYRFFSEGTGWSPREYIYFFILGKNPSLDLCLQCRSCQASCPLEIDLPGMILDAKGELASKRRMSLTDTLLSNAETLEKWGSSLAPLANPASSIGALRWLGEKTLGVSKERHLPRFRGGTFARWFQSGDGKS